MIVKILLEERANPELIEKAKRYKNKIEEEYRLFSYSFWKFWENVEKNFPDSCVPARGGVDVLICVPTSAPICSPEAIEFALQSLKD